MKRTQLCLIACLTVLTVMLLGCSGGQNDSNMQSNAPEPGTASVDVQNDEDTALKIQVETDSERIIFALNDSAAARSFYEQLPLTLPVEDYSTNEKIFYPPEELDVSGAPQAEGPEGTLAYYEPWGDVVMFYSPCGNASGLYGLGEAVSGAEQIEHLSGEIRIEKVDVAVGGQQKPETLSSPEAGTGEKDDMREIEVTVNGETFSAALYDSETTKAFAEMLPLTLTMSDYSGFEKVGSLGTSLPADNQQTTVQSGDIVLYNGNQIVMFYGSHSWSYTRLGRIEDLSGWKEALGSGDVSVTFQTR